VNFPQCAVGLQSPDGQPIQKFTTLSSSTESLVNKSRELHCYHKSHWILEGGSNTQRRTAYAQVWPPKMCDIIVDGIRNSVQGEFTQVYAGRRALPPGVNSIAQDVNETRHGMPHYTPTKVNHKHCADITIERLLD